ncbi:flagellar biosynthesis protein FliQ [Moritella viscosa]|uniref:Flagellar biosynthetic protein FliQ n=1 Tax=Moritella viscosa TaxID=80854 RepID=A0A090K4S7_9GAMM|nr:flagellar biosynthesis protein FliQ [Moritella viscosa]CED58773.1 polar flagellar biosynthetic protein FliQ [Moritella viscosa]SGY83608.1 Flagellar biosynthetic protein [Moritella viscosa]SGY84178.1 Flagellar biosynthetic protein [Moritella viscosa]SGY84292.1 Flagellar biosynthetic protein [Moritella viscosa]SGY84903.1 Flagellar biosynthetic protein [Moritella viscosa]
MTPEQVVSLMGLAVNTIIAMVSVLVIPGLVVGLIVSVFQAATQIQEQTLSFLPKLIVTLLMVTFAGHWLLAQVSALFDYMFLNIPGLIG